MKLLNIIRKLISYALLPFGVIIFKIKKPKTLIVLGMHRSGTSCITRILNQNGLSLGKDLIQADSGNPQGYWENLSVYWINERILKNSNGSWDNPPKTVLANIYIQFEILRILYIRNWKNPHLIIKDPRLVLTWDIWKTYLKNYQILTVFRNPDSVAKSLNRRDGMIFEKGIKLWETYNKKILQIQKNEKMMFLDFDDENSFHTKIEKIICNLNLDFNVKSLQFYNPSFKTSDSKFNQNPSKIYKKLLTIV